MRTVLSHMCRHKLGFCPKFLSKNMKLISVGTVLYNDIQIQLPQLLTKIILRRSHCGATVCDFSDSECYVSTGAERT